MPEIDHAVTAPHAQLANKSLERTIYMRHGSCSELQLPRRIPLVAQFWR
jgi:hypothetical protein